MIICVEGLIGVGKSTLCEALDGEKFYEPVGSNPFLELYYEDKKRWAYAMQVNLLAERFAMFQRAQWAEGDCVMDRSYYGDYAFAIVQKKQGMMTDAEFASYVKMHKLHQRYLGFPDIILRLVLPLEEEQKRIRERGRDCEKDLDPAYLMALSEAYDDLFEELKSECTVVEIDASQSKEDVIREAKAAIERIRNSDACISERYPHYKRA